MADGKQPLAFFKQHPALESEVKARADGQGSAWVAEKVNVADAKRANVRKLLDQLATEKAWH